MNETARHTICSYADRVGEFTLTDDVQDGEGKLNPNVFLCLAQLQSPLKPLFPNIRCLRIINADQSLDYLRLFLSPSLETLEIIGLGEACRPTLLSFLSAAVVEVPDLSTLILGPGRLSRDVVDACLGFGRLKHLELVDVISEVDFRLLKDIGLLEHLETFVIDAQDVVYSPSRALIQADEDAYARVVAEEECRLQKIKEEEREPRRRLDEVEERQRKAIRPRIEGICWMCERRFKKATHKTQCSSCSLEIYRQQRTREEEERRARQADIERLAIEAEEERLAREAEIERAIDAEVERLTRQVEEQRAIEMERLARERRMARRNGMPKERRAREADMERLTRESKEERLARKAEVERLTREKEAEELLKLEEEAIIKAESERREKDEELRRIQESQCPEPAEEEDEMEDLGDVFEMGGSIIDASLSVERKDDTNGLHMSSVPEADDFQASIDRQGELLHPKFPKLLNITVRGSAEMMQDAVQLITSASVVFLYLDMVLVQPSTSGIAPPPSRRFVDIVDSALRRWASTIAHVTLSGLPSVASKLPDETMEALVRLPQLEHLELNGWDFDFKIADYFKRRLSDTGASRLKVLHLPDDNNAISIILSELDSIAKACPDLLSLRCHLKNLLDTPGFPFSGSQLLSHSLEILTIGDTNPPLDFDAILKVVRYIDNIFPNIKDINPLEGMAQNAEQWRQIDKLVKLRQSGWLDRMRS